METEHSLLDQISRKESELKQHCDVVCREAEDRIHEARARARHVREDADQKGAEEASVYLQKGLDELAAQIQSMKAEGDREAAEILSRGEKRVDSAANRISQMALE